MVENTLSAYQSKRPESSKFEAIETIYETISVDQPIEESLTFKLSDYGFIGQQDEATKEESKFIRANCVPVIQGWAKQIAPEAIGFSFNDEPLPFAQVNSCPLPKLNDYGGISCKTLTSTTYFKYNSSSGVCEVSTDGKTYETIGSGFTGIFVGLQGGGGGGGGAMRGNIHISTLAKAGGGGGGGGFIWAYLDLSHPDVQDEVIIIDPGSAGSAGNCVEDNTTLNLSAGKGGDGGSTTLSCNAQTYLIAYGGKGGEGGRYGSTAEGGEGGGTQVKSSVSWITVLKELNGKSGGRGGVSGTIVAAIPLKEAGEDGESFDYSVRLDTPCMKTAPKVRYSNGNGYYYGEGSFQLRIGEPDLEAYCAFGGGGGASVRGCRMWNGLRWGQGDGGVGGAAWSSFASEENRINEPTCGGGGCIIYAPIN